MKRDKLAGIVRRAASEREYAFYTGETHALGATVREYPAAWLAPPVVHSVSGRREGEVTYRMVLHLVALPTAAESESLWANLEADALQIAAKIAGDEAVCGVSGVSCTPARGSLTAHGEISVALRCDVTMWYYI